MTYSRFPRLNLLWSYAENIRVDAKDMSVSTLAKNRARRAELFQNAFRVKSWTSRDLNARREYWYKQAFFLIRLLNRKDSTQIDTIDKLKNALLYYCKNSDRLTELLNYIIQDYQERSEFKEEKSSSDEKRSESFSLTVAFYQTDVILVMKNLIEMGFMPVVDNAANANRDGAAKTGQGSLEELISRCTDSLFTMLCHFRDVDAEHEHRVSDHKMVKLFRLRYLYQCLSLLYFAFSCDDNADDYFNNTLLFLDDLFHCKQGWSIYFDLMNKVYEVPANSGFASANLFFEEKLSSLTAFKKQIASFDEKKISPVSVIYSAAPDRRTFEGGSIDKLCTLDKTLRKPEAKESLETMVTGGVNTQCNTALTMQNRGLLPVILFVLPGCGAFANPLEETVEIFISAIKKREPELRQKNIPFGFVEYNRATCALLKSTWEKYNKPIPKPVEPKKDWKYKLACGTFYLLFPVIYLIWFHCQLKQYQKELAIYTRANQLTLFPSSTTLLTQASSNQQTLRLGKGVS